MSWYFTADWHLNHANIIKYCNRPFLDSEEKELVEASSKGLIPIKSIRISPDSVNRMNDAIIDATNKVVEEEDNLVIIGDFCWSSTPKKEISELLSRLKCKNLYLIWGNHDNRQTFLPFFKSTYDHYIFYIEGQHVFTIHYPCKSWPHSSYGSWLLYGHVHNRLWHQDNGLMSEQEENSVKEVLNNFDLPCDKLNDLAKSIGSIFRKRSLSLDVGVDNQREGVPFGTPWSFSDVRLHMESKLVSNVSP